jgi:hypothetical protein
MTTRDNEPLAEDRLYDEERDRALAEEARDTSVGPDAQAGGLRDRDPMLDPDGSAGRDDLTDVTGRGGLTDREGLPDREAAADRDVVAEPDALGNHGDATSSDALADRDAWADSRTTDAGARSDDDVEAGRGGLSGSDALSGDEIASGTAASSTGTAATGATATGTESAGDREPLVRPDLAMDLNTRWEVIQQGFVDDPRTAVSDADSLVDEVLQRLSDSFGEQQRKLESQWHEGEPSTEDLRSALQRYRAFFHRLLEV